MPRSCAPKPNLKIAKNSVDNAQHWLHPTRSPSCWQDYESQSVFHQCTFFFFKSWKKVRPVHGSPIRASLWQPSLLLMPVNHFAISFVVLSEQPFEPSWPSRRQFLTFVVLMQGRCEVGRNCSSRINYSFFFSPPRLAFPHGGGFNLHKNLHWSGGLEL